MSDQTLRPSLFYCGAGPEPHSIEDPLRIDFHLMKGAQRGGVSISLLLDKTLACLLNSCAVKHSALHDYSSSQRRHCGSCRRASLGRRAGCTLVQKLVKGGGHLKDVKRKLFMQEFTSHFTVKSAGSAARYPQNQLVSYINFSRGTFYLQTISCYRITHMGPNLVLFDSFSSIFGPL